MKRIKRYIRNCADGLEAVEGLIVITLVMIVLVFFLSFIFFLYQQALVVNAANDTATRIAQSYAYPNTDPVTGYISRTMRISLNPFRYMGQDLDNKSAEKGEKYARWYLDLANLAFSDGEPDVSVQTISDGLAQRHVEVVVKATYQIPLGGILELIGLPDTVTYQCTGRAPCIDLNNYIYAVNSLDALTHSTLGSEALGMVDAILGLVQDIKELFTR